MELQLIPVQDMQYGARDSFDLFWSAYPRKVGKGKARQLWARKKPDLEQCLKALEWQKQSDQWKKENGAFIPHPSTWIGQERWEDEPPTEPEKPQPREVCAKCYGAGVYYDFQKSAAVICACRKTLTEKTNQD